METLAGGITAKAALWRALENLAGDEPRLAAFDFPALGSSALKQRERVEVCHLAVVTADGSPAQDHANA